MIAVVMSVGWSASAVAAPALFSYDARYDVQLARSSPSTGPRAASGTLDVRLRETCTGWDTRSRVTIDLTFRDGTMITNVRDFESFEAKNGRSYTFAVRTVKGGVPVEAFRGTAKLNPRRAGKVVYELPGSGTDGPKPRKITITLPSETLLPVRHAQTVLAEAEKGGRLFRSVLFNGASSVGPRIMSTVIGPQRSPIALDDAAAVQIDPAALSVPAWDFSMAYYNLFDRRETPTFELFQRVYATGVAPSFEQQFGDFTIRADLDRLERLAPEACNTR